jgi:uncharacterized coiled-coil protein SlyX
MEQQLIEMLEAMTKAVKRIDERLEALEADKAHHSRLIDTQSKTITSLTNTCINLKEYIEAVSQRIDLLQK